MKTARKIIELETLLEHLSKKYASSLLKYKVLFYISEYENLSVSMIIDKLGIKKSNFALMSADFIKEGLCEAYKTSTDKRCKCLKLTQKGKNELESYLNDLQEELKSKNLSGDVFNDKLDEIIKILNKVI